MVILQRRDGEVLNQIKKRKSAGQKKNKYKKKGNDPTTRLIFFDLTGD